MSKKRVAVTGASRGIGRAIAERLAELGARVVGGSRSPRAADLARPNLIATQVDVRDAASVDRYFGAIEDELGGLDALVLCAGIGVFAPLTTLGNRDWDDVIQTNLTGAFYCVRRALPLMLDKGGRIIAVGSVADHVPLADAGAYAASKYGLRGLVEVLNLECAEAGVLATLLSPGAVATDIWRDRDGFDPRDMLAPADVAQTVVDILSRPPGVRIDEIRLMPRKGILKG